MPAPILPAVAFVEKGFDTACHHAGRDHYQPYREDGRYYPYYSGK